MNKQSISMFFVLAATLGAGCGEPQNLPTDVLAQQETTDNGMALNGLSWNGLSWNGLSWNGLSWNGLSWNGLSWNGLSSRGLSSNNLSTDAFNSWFLGQESGTPYTNMVMRYLVKCAAPSGTTLSTTVNGVSYSWPGQFGLAPEWTSGNPIPLAEQQLITACLAAHVNKFGLHVNLSVQGYQSNGLPISNAVHELQNFPIKEGCFFGNVFTGEGVYVGNDSVWSSDKSSSRECAITVPGQPNNNCLPMTFAGNCSKICVPDGPHNAYYSCSYNGKSYSSINTRITNSDIYQCGDHICQVSESCGTGNTPDNCKDCGPCQ